MKKMFKKSIAVLIAVLMIVTSLPFTAITAFAWSEGTGSNSSTKPSNWDSYISDLEVEEINSWDFTSSSGYVRDGSNKYYGSGDTSKSGAYLYNTISVAPTTYLDVWTGSGSTKNYMYYGESTRGSSSKVFNSNSDFRVVMNAGINANNYDNWIVFGKDEQVGTKSNAYIYMRFNSADTWGDLYVNGVQYRSDLHCDFANGNKAMSESSYATYDISYDASAKRLCLNLIGNVKTWYWVFNDVDIDPGLIKNFSLGTTDAGFNGRLCSLDLYGDVINNTKDYIIPSGISASTANTSPKTFQNQNSYFGTALVPGYTGNVIYCEKSVNLDEDTGNYLGKKMCVPKNTVMIYDGANDTYMPVFAGFYNDGSNNVYVSYVTLNWGSNPFSIDTWTGAMKNDLDNNTGTLKNSPSQLSVTTSINLPNYSNNNDNIYWAKDGREDGDFYFWTKMKYNGTGNIESFYDKYTNPIFQYGHRNKVAWIWYNRTVNKTVSNTNIYVVNYKQVRDVLANVTTVNALGQNYTFKNLFNEVWSNQSHYTYASVNKYYQAVSELVSIDPQSYFTSATASTVESQTQALAADIKEAYNDYLDAAKALEEKPKYTFVRSAQTIKTVWADSVDEALADAPELTADTQKTPNNDGTHSWTSYSWNQSGNVFTETATKNIVKCSTKQGIIENHVDATCTKSGTYDIVQYCDDCGYKRSTTTVDDTSKPALGHSYPDTWTYKDETHHSKTCIRGDNEITEEHTLVDGYCSTCDGSVLDESAYNEAINNATNVIMENAKYVAYTYNNFTTVYNEVKASKKTVTKQSELDALVTKLNTAISELKLKEVTIVVTTENDSTGETVTLDTVKGTYGELSKIDSQLADNANVTKWTVKYDGRISTYNTFEKVLEYIPYGDVEVTVYYTTQSTEEETYSKVIFKGLNGKTLDIQYLKAGEVPTAPDYTVAFYDITWDEMTAVDGTSTYTYQAKCTFKTDAKQCGIHYSGFDGGVKYYDYDTIVILPDTDSSKNYALAKDEAGTEIITYLNDTKFFAPKRDDIYVVEVDDIQAKVGVTGSYFTDNLANNKVSATFNCKYSLPEGATKYEIGVYITVRKGGNVVKAGKAVITKESTLHEFTPIIRIDKGLGDEIEIKPYIIYTMNDQQIEYIGEAATQELN